MDLAALFRAAGRRWYVLIAGLLLTAGLAYIVLRFVPPTYNVETSVLLLPPISSVESIGTEVGDEEDSGNPFLNLGGLDVVAGVLAKAVTDSESVRSIVPDGSRAEYMVEPDATVAGSVLAVTVSDATAAGAFSTLDAVLELSTARLQTLQESVGATGDDQVRLMVITNNSVATLDLASLVRTLIVVIAAGLVLSLLLAVSVDALARRRRRARAAADVPSVPPATPGSGDVDVPATSTSARDDTVLVRDGR